MIDRRGAVAAGRGSRTHHDMRAAPHLKHGRLVAYHDRAQADGFQPEGGGRDIFHREVDMTDPHRRSLIIF